MATEVLPTKQHSRETIEEMEYATYSLSRLWDIKMHHNHTAS